MKNKLKFSKDTRPSHSYLGVSSTGDESRRYKNLPELQVEDLTSFQVKSNECKISIVSLFESLVKFFLFIRILTRIRCKLACLSIFKIPVRKVNGKLSKYMLVLLYLYSKEMDISVLLFLYYMTTEISFQIQSQCDLSFKLVRKCVYLLALLSYYFSLQNICHEQSISF